MGVYIKNMKMPTDQFYPIHATIYADGTVITGHGIGQTAKEAVPVPKHGRLIDADALIIDLMDRGVEGLQTDDWHEIQQSVLDAPAVIEAEGEQ